MTYKAALQQEYTACTEMYGPQPKAGQDGHLNAVMTHGLTKAEARVIAAAGFPVWFFHGRHDILAAPKYGERLARRWDTRLAVSISLSRFVVPLYVHFFLPRPADGSG